MKTTILLFISFLFLGHLQSQGWVRQNPFAQLARLNDVDFDGVHGLTVGNEGILFTTDDGGNTWTSRKTPDADEDLKTAFVLPGSNGQTMLAGGDSLLLLSINGGETWTINFNDIQGIYKIQVMPTGQWIVLGATYSAISSDQGGFWLPFNNPALGATAGHFTSPMNGWMEAGDFNNSQVWVTTNGGFSWELRDPVKFSSITDLEMLDDSTGYLISGSQVYKTTNGGWSWESKNAVPTGNLTDMYIVNANEIWTSVDNGDVLYSLTSGNGWTERSPDLINNNNSQGIFADHDGHIYMAGKYVSMLYSNDFGLTWRDQIPGNKATLFQPHFNNELIGIVGGSDGTLMRTVNGGTIWETIQFPRDDHFFAAAMIDNQAMVVGSSRGRVYFSDNQGASWDTIGTGLGQITDIQAFNHQNFIITTEDGRIYKTTNQGGQWNKKYDNGGKPLFALDFVSGQNGWACGYEGEIVVTTNSGDNWTVQPTPGKAKFSDITFTNGFEGWAVSTSFTDSLWYTQDAGQSWHVSQLPYKSFWNGISFTNRDTGWIAGGVSGVGDILRTNDRGVTWSQNHTSPELFLGIYAVPDKETVWAVGFGGNIMKYTPCNTLPFIADLTGETSPCVGDTVQYSVTSLDVDHYLWIFPPGWTVISNPDSSSITAIAGENPGDIQVKASNVCGNLTPLLIEPITPVSIPQITIGETKGNVLFTNLTSLEYQWLLNGVPIPGANGPFYTALEDGTYELIATIPGTGCSGISNELVVTIVGIEDTRNDKMLVYPVPATNLLYVSSLSGKDDFENDPVLLFAPDGRMVKNEKLVNGKMDVSGLNSGLYLLMIKTDRETLVKKVLIE